MQTRQHPAGDRLGHEDNEVRAAIRFAILAAVAGVAFLIVAALWASTCQGAMSIDTTACGAPQLTILAFGAPLILLAAGVLGICAYVSRLASLRHLVGMAGRRVVLDDPDVCHAHHGCADRRAVSGSLTGLRAITPAPTCGDLPL